MYRVRFQAFTDKNRVINVHAKNAFGQNVIDYSTNTFRIGTTIESFESIIKVTDEQKIASIQVSFLVGGQGIGEVCFQNVEILP